MLGEFTTSAATAQEASRVITESARLVRITGTRAPGSNGTQDFGMFDADSAGNLNGRKVAACSTTNMEDGQNESVTFTAMDSATSGKATARVPGGAWVCQ